jgi:hypothetical protein
MSMILMINEKVSDLFKVFCLCVLRCMWISNEV